MLYFISIDTEKFPYLVGLVRNALLAFEVIPKRFEKLANSRHWFSSDIHLDWNLVNWNKYLNAAVREGVYIRHHHREGN